MLPQKYRLNTRVFLIDKSFTHKITTPMLNYRVKKIDQISPSKISCIVPKKLSKFSTKRNRTKRLLGEAILPLLPKLKTGLWILIYAQKLLLKEKPTHLQNIIAKDMDKISRLLS